jgi:hypothetical protein
MHSFILSKHPVKYLHQSPRYCWAYSLKAVIEPHTHINREYTQYASSWLTNLIGYMTPKWLCKVLKRYGLRYTHWYIFWNKQSQLASLKELLLQWPIILQVSKMYGWKRKFNLRKFFRRQHYVSLRWYDDTKSIFYLYDSQPIAHMEQHNLPIGNICMQYEDLLYYWGFGWWGISPYTYISVDYT